jgi:hypothetical protein
LHENVHNSFHKGLRHDKRGEALSCTRGFVCALFPHKFWAAALQLKLDNVKLVYAIDRETGLPTGQAVYVQKEANQLVEEFMLLANITVATRIYKAFPAAAMLRRQPLPLCMSCAPRLVSVAGAG